MKMTNDVVAALLLTSRLPGMSQTDVQPLGTGEWNALLAWLKDKNLKPGDLLLNDPSNILRDWDDPRCQGSRIQELLNRGMALSLALEKWQRAGIWVLARSEPEYPRRLKERLKSKCPPIIFGCGNIKLLESGGVAVIGSRNASSEDEKFALSLGRNLAGMGKTIISGGARGVDQAAMFGAIEAGGTVIGVLADSLLKTSVSSRYRQALLRKDIVLVSPFHPEAAFNVGNAMARNKYIYCLSDLAIAVHSSTKGGTWNGAIENLKGRWVPLWVKRTKDTEAANGKLVEKGAMWLPESSLDDDSETLRKCLADEKTEFPEQSVFLAVEENPADRHGSQDAPISNEMVSEKLDVGNLGAEKTLYEMFCLKLVRILSSGAMGPKDIGQRLGITEKQLKIWLKQAVEEGLIAKKTSPVRYELPKAKGPRQLSFFESR